MSNEENLEKIKKEYQKGSTYKEICEKFDITRNRLVYLKDKYNWKRKESSRVKAAKKNKNAVTTGLYETLFKGAFTDEELSFFMDKESKIDAQDELIKTYKSLLIRKARIMKRLKTIEQSEKELNIDSIKKKNDGYSTETETIAKSKNDDIVKFHRALTDVDNQILRITEKLIINPIENPQLDKLDRILSELGGVI